MTHTHTHTHTHTNASLKVRRFKRQNGNKRTDGQTDASDCLTFPANAVGNNCAAATASNPHQIEQVYPSS